MRDDRETETGSLTRLKEQLGNVDDGGQPSVLRSGKIGIFPESENGSKGDLSRVSKGALVYLSWMSSRDLHWIYPVADLITVNASSARYILHNPDTH